MSSPIGRTRAAWLLAVPILYFLYFFGLARVGLIGPDEPRYASIGREMAISGDWVTPRLWGEPWFEKPALLYWVIGASHRLGLGPETGPRLPVALLSVTFVAGYFFLLSRHFGSRAALYSSLMLATSAGWVAFSQVAVTDLPMSVAFSAAMLLAMHWIETGRRGTLALAGALLGVAVLAKGLVPLVLAAPLVWFARRRLRAILPGAVAFVAVAGPWYALCFLRNGRAFWDEFFLRHHFQRYSTDALAHEQPFWFYVPVLLAGLFPWTPLMTHVAGRAALRDWKRQLLVVWLLFGFLFFSVSTNKLPGYLLPLVPAACALMGIGLAETRKARWPLALAALLLALFPVIAAVLPGALLAGLRRAGWPDVSWLWLAPATGIAAATWILEGKGKRLAAAALVAASAGAGVVWLKAAALDRMDEKISARPLWNAVARDSSAVCVERMHRAWRYGLNYYSGTPLPDCSETPRLIHIRQQPGEPPRLERVSGPSEGP